MCVCVWLGRQFLVLSPSAPPPETEREREGQERGGRVRGGKEEERERWREKRGEGGRELVLSTSISVDCLRVVIC